MASFLREIKEVVKEELGVSDEVKKHVEGIFRDIIMDAKLNGVNEKPNIKTGEFFYQVGKTMVKVIYKVIYLNNMNELDQDDYVANTDFLSPKSFELTTTLIYDRSQNKYVDFDGSLQHEFEHLYQEMRAGKPFLIKDKSRDIYEKAIELTMTATKKSEKIVGYAVYYNSKFEQDAYANDIYKMMMDNRCDNPYSVLKNSDTYRNVNYIKGVVLDKDNSAIFGPIVEKHFGKTYNWFYRLTKHMVGEFKKRVGKAYVKALKDIEEQNKENNTTDGGRLSAKIGKITEND